MTLATRITLTVAAMLLACAPAEARHHYRHLAPACVGWFCPDAAQPVARATQHARTRQFAALGRDAAMQPHPSGCPSRAFCGCGAAMRVFGNPVRSLWLASNWYRFPRAAPAQGMVGVTRHHVFVLESHVEGSTWIVYDANSGGGGTRIHARSISGYTIVNPHGGSIASM